jgi:hypothetical protein
MFYIWAFLAGMATVIAFDDLDLHSGWSIWEVTGAIFYVLAFPLILLVCLIFFIVENFPSKGKK